MLGAVREEVRAFAHKQEKLPAPEKPFTPEAPALRALSPLAEGTDRLFAEAALECGYALHCPLPFAQDEFEKDFPDSLGPFRALLNQAEVRFELDGLRARAGEAYRHCGRVVLNQSDVLFVVWDGERQGKKGGTEETLDEARQLGVPVVWIDAQAPHRWQIPAAADNLDDLPDGVRAVPSGKHTIEKLRGLVRVGLEVCQPGDKACVSAHNSPPRLPTLA